MNEAFRTCIKLSLPQYLYKYCLSPRGDSTLIGRVCAIGVLNLPPCSSVENPKKYTLYCNQEIMQNYALHCIVLYTDWNTEGILWSDWLRGSPHCVRSIRLECQNNYVLVWTSSSVNKSIVLYCIVLYYWSQRPYSCFTYLIEWIYHSTSVLPCLCKSFKFSIIAISSSYGICSAFQN